MSVTSNDYFIKVAFSARLNKGGPLDLGAAKLTSGGQTYLIARDAQRLAGSRELSLSLKPEEKVELVMFFEAPKAAIGPGLKLVVVGDDGISLQ